MGEFHFNKTKYEDAAQKVMNASKDFKSAMVRVTAVNKEFLGKVGGVWATAEDAITGEYEASLRSVDLAMDNLAKNMKSAGDAALSQVMTGRDSVFQVVGASAKNRDDAWLKDGDVGGAGNQAQLKCCSVRGQATKTANLCTGFRRCGDVAGIMKSLVSSSDTCRRTVMDIQDAFSSYKSDVESFEGTYSSTFNPDNFLTSDMAAKANSATAANLGFAPKYGVKVTKQFMSDIGAIFKGEPNFGWHDKTWKKGGFKAAWTKKLSESSHGLLNFQPDMKGKNIWQRFKSQHQANFKDIIGDQNYENMGTKASLKSAVSHGAVTAEYADEAIKGLPKQKVSFSTVGKGLKAASRYVGVVGDAFTVADIVSKTGKAYQDGGVGAAVGQAVKGVVKMGAGKAIGAAIGACFGGPLGVVAGVAIGGALQMVSDWIIDSAFNFFSGGAVKTYN